MKKQQAGFTLIELVMVIVILGILSAFALPRFANLGSDANEAVLEAGAGATKSAAAIVHSAWLAGGSTDTTIDLEGSSIAIVDGYPDATSAAIGVAAGLTDDFTVTAGGTGGSGTTITFSPSSSATCSFVYTAATSVAAANISAQTITGC